MAGSVTLEPLVLGDDAVYVVTVTRAGVAIDLRLANTKLWFTAKRSLSDADGDAVIAKSAGVGGGPGGITVPAAAPGNVANIGITDADTTELTGTARLYYDVQLEEPDGTKTTVARGTLPVIADVTKA